MLMYDMFYLAHNHISTMISYQLATAINSLTGGEPADVWTGIPLFIKYLIIQAFELHSRIAKRSFQV